MRSHDIPAEFEELLSRQGRRVLAGTHPLCGALADPRRRFLMADDLIDRARAARLRRALEAELIDTLEPIERPIPPESIWDMKRDYGELLPKTTRARTIYFESRRDPGVKAAERIGLSPSPCLARVRRLEQSGLIRRYVTLLDPIPLGLTVSVFPPISAQRVVVATTGNHARHVLYVDMDFAVAVLRDISI